MRRNLLRSHLKQACACTINGPYAQMLINSERGLQVYFCMALHRIFEQKGLEQKGFTRRLFVEPSVDLPDGRRRSPDLLICDAQRVIGVVELKYTPRALPKTQKDFETLALIGARSGACNDSIQVANKRFRGSKQGKPYPIADDAIFCWAGVHADHFAPDRSGLKSLKARYLELNAVTSTSSVRISAAIGAGSSPRTINLAATAASNTAR